VTSSNGPTVVLTHVSGRGSGIPGTLTATVTYTWTKDDELKIHYHATTDKPTVVNLTNRSSQPGGSGQRHGSDQVLQIFADKFTPGVGPDPDRRVAVAGTPFDFRSRPPSARASTPATLTLGGGYDHNFVVNGAAGTCILIHVIVLQRPRDGRSDPADVQFHTGNFLDGKIGKGGRSAKRAGFCLERAFPDSPNKPKFPSTVLAPGSGITRRRCIGLELRNRK
jgi:aldose 1-epimerase